MTSSRIRRHRTDCRASLRPEPVSEDELAGCRCGRRPPPRVGLVAGDLRGSRGDPARLRVRLGRHQSDAGRQPRGEPCVRPRVRRRRALLCALRGSPRAAIFGYRRVGWGRPRAHFRRRRPLLRRQLRYGAAVQYPWQRQASERFRGPRSTAAMLGTAAFVCIAAPICEELFFRGFVFGVLRRMRSRSAAGRLGR